MKIKTSSITVLLYISTYTNAKNIFQIPTLPAVDKTDLSTFESDIETTNSKLVTRSLDVVPGSSIKNTDIISKSSLKGGNDDIENSVVPKLPVKPVKNDIKIPTNNNNKVSIPSNTQNNYKFSKTTELNSFLMSSVMILFSEIGDKTFLVAALMAMRYSRVTVFSAAFLALAIMTILSGILGHTLPSLLSPKYTRYIACCLFIIFGFKLMKEGLAMDSNTGVEDEMHEVEEEIEMRTVETDDLEKGKYNINNNNSTNSSTLNKTSKDQDSALSIITEGLTNLFNFILSPIWLQVFVMTFLGEWGDRSQIATIALAAGSDYWFVILGAILGHGVCTLAAVIGGQLLASKISMRTVTIAGASAFFVFAFIYLFEAINT